MLQIVISLKLLLKKIEDFPKYEIIKKRKDLTIYKYSNVKRESNHELVYQYFFDSFVGSDYEKAYFDLYFGKTEMEKA